MKLNLRWILGLTVLAGLAPGLGAADVIITYRTNTTYVTNSTGALNYAGVALVTIPTSNGVRVALNAQVLLLQELAQEHQKRARDLAQKNQPEKVKWETELASELQEKSAQVQKGIELIPSALGTNGTNAAGEANDELIFVSRVEERLEQINQDLVTVLEQGRVLAVQMGTNTAPENIPGMSFALEDNQRILKQLQRDQLDLELRKLEFRALRRAIQK